MNFDLNIDNYNFKDILQLFDLNSEIEISCNDIRSAKIKVLSMHPDKSGLSSEYFIFYKRAYEILLPYYHSQPEVKINTIVGERNNVYDSGDNDEKSSKIKTELNKMDVKDFNVFFNTLYNDNMIDKKRQKNETENNRWFTDQYHDENKSLNNICKYKGVQDRTSEHMGSKIYDEDDNGSYIYCNPSSKLLFDDLRKVHLNETVLNIEVSNIEPKQKFKNCDELRLHRKDDEVKVRTETEKLKYDGDIIENNN